MLHSDLFCHIMKYLVEVPSWPVRHKAPVSQNDRDAVARDAVRHLHGLLLQDLRPPWLTDAFTQALPGDSTLSRYSRPCFLEWPADVSKVDFGVDVAAELADKTSRVSKTFAGIVARPLYACTAFKLRARSEVHTKLCGKVASMSPLLEFPAEREHWLCADCLRRGAPVSDSAPRRMLRLYPNYTFAFSPHCCFGLHTTSRVFMEGASTRASPLSVAASVGAVWKYSEAESEAIWLTAKAFDAID